MKIVLIGIQGSGKSTQGNMLSHQLDIPYLSTGHIFREIAKEHTALGRYVKETINAGILIPDEKVIAIVNEYLQHDEYQNGYILDGFPRTTVQAKEFSNNVDSVVYLKVPDQEALWRIAHRNDTAREDETLIAIKKRIETFHKSTTPVIEYYRKRGKLLEVDGTKSIKEVNEYVLKQLGKTVGKHGVTNWRKRNKLVMGIVGLPGAGKSYAATFFKEKGLPVLRLGAITDEEIKKRGLENNIHNNRVVREEFRKHHGMDAYVKLNMQNIRQLLEENQVVILDGLRSFEEYLSAKKLFKNIFVLAVVADKKIRYARVARRKDRSNLKGEERDVHEVLGLNMGPTIAFADKTIINNGSATDFEDKLEEVYRQVYYGLS
ncbi:MAG: nucleoside monophosphate kinase [Patescibacteria group bacterium]|jgi:adenylate kinase